MPREGATFYGGRRVDVPAEREEDCPPRTTFDPVNKICIDRTKRKSAELAKLAKEDIARQNEKLRNAQHNKRLRAVDARFDKIKKDSKRYPKTWTLAPGDKGFNAEALRAMQKAGVDKEPFEVTCPPHGQLLDKAKVVDQPYQKTAAFLFHPSSPVTRLLVAVRTGGGKTLIMIRALSNYYDDRRPKLIVFPSEPIAKQFYGELMAYDNPYRDYVLKELDLPPTADYFARSRKNKLSGDEIQHVEDILGLKGHPGQAGKPGKLAAPVRAVSYRQLGGATLGSMAWVRPKEGEKFFTTAKGVKRENILEDKIVLMDEAQNLIKPNPEVLKLESTRENLERAREMLRYATKSAIAFFTATPVIDEATDGEKLMRIVRGVINEHKPTNEGFITSFVSNPESAYPAVEPLAEEMPALVSVPLSGDPENKTTSLGGYLEKLLKGAKGRKVIDPAFLKNKNRIIYEYTQAYHTSQGSSDFLKRLRNTPDIVAPKLAAAARLATSIEGKVILLTNKSNGFFSLYYLFQNCPEFASFKDKVLPLLGAAKTTRGDYKPPACNGFNYSNTKNYQQCVRGRFDADDNIDGDKLKILILNAEEFSEGIDFKDVRAVIMVDVPESWAKLKQRVGRAVRQCSHIRLSKDKWKVRVYILCATLPPKIQFKSGQELDLSGVPTVDEQMLVRVMAQRSVIEEKTCDLVNVATDRKILSNAAGVDVCNRKREKKEENKEDEDDDDDEEPTEAQKGDMDEAVKQVAKAYATYKHCLSLHDTPEMKKDFVAHTNALMKCSNTFSSVVQTITDNLVPWYAAAEEKGAVNCALELNADGCANFCNDRFPITEDPNTGVKHNEKENMRCRQRTNPAPKRRNSPAATASATAEPIDPEDFAIALFGNALRTAMDPIIVEEEKGSKCENCPDGKTEEQCFEYCTSKGYGGKDLYECISRTIDPADNRTCSTSGRAPIVRADIPQPKKGKGRKYIIPEGDDDPIVRQKPEKATKNKTPAAERKTKAKRNTTTPAGERKAKATKTIPPDDAESDDDDTPIKKRRGSTTQTVKTG